MLYSEQMKLEKCESFYISALNISPVKSCTFPGEILWYFLFSVQQKMCREREVDGSMSFTLFTDMHSSCLMEIKMLPIITASRWKKKLVLFTRSRWLNKKYGQEITDYNHVLFGLCCLNNNFIAFSWSISYALELSHLKDFPFAVELAKLSTLRYFSIDANNKINKNRKPEALMFYSNFKKMETMKYECLEASGLKLSLTVYSYHFSHLWCNKYQSKWMKSHL